MQAPGETKSNVEIFRLLAERLGFTEPCFADTEDDMIRSLLDSKSPYVSGITLEELETKSFVRLKVSASPNGSFLPFAKGGFRTSSGKYEFGACQLAYSPPAESRLGDPDLVSRYPLELISSKNDDSMNSTFGHRSELISQASRVEIHPEDASRRAIIDGAAVEIFNDRGSCTFTAVLSHNVGPGILRVRSMGWNKFAPHGSGVNRLTSERLTDLGDGATFFSCLVDARLAPSSVLKHSTVLLTTSTAGQEASPVLRTSRSTLPSLLLSFHIA